MLELTPNGVISYLGNYDYYTEKKGELEELNSAALAPAMQKEEPEKPSDTASSNKERFLQDKEAKKAERQRQRRIEQVEAMIEELEGSIAALEEELCKPEVFQDHEKSLELTGNIERKKAELETCLEEWADLQE